MYLGYVYNSHLEHSYIVLRVVQCFMSRLRKEKVQKSPMWASRHYVTLTPHYTMGLRRYAAPRLIR